MMAHQDYKSYRYNQAFMKYALASELGYEVAQSNSAFILDRNEVTMFKTRHEALVRALQYWGRSAAQGYSTAQVRMGDYHYYGLGTDIDYDLAASHYRYFSVHLSLRSFSLTDSWTVMCFQLEWHPISSTTHRQSSIWPICMSKDWE